MHITLSKISAYLRLSKVYLVGCFYKLGVVWLVWVVAQKLLETAPRVLIPLSLFGIDFCDHGFGLLTGTWKQAYQY